jgi:hypothetical protein
MKLIHWLFAFCLLTASFDVFLVVQVGGTVRIAQIVMLFVCMGALAKAAQDGYILWPAGGTALALWCAGQIALLPVGVDLSFGIRYLAILFFTILCFYAVVHLYGRSTYIESLMRIYISTYVFVAIFGILQISTPLLHMGSFLVVQWIFADKLARINGFSYEPSYYATYLLMGWITLLDLRASKARIVATRKWYWSTVLVTAALFLSTSKAGWIFMILEGGMRIVPVWFRWAGNLASRLQQGSLKVRIPRWKVLTIGFFLTTFAVGGIVALGNAIDLNIFLAGTGINHTAAHSVSERGRAFEDTVMVFKEHPFVGQSLGGVGSRICQINDLKNDGKNCQGFPVIMDLLAASGLIGIIPFLLFVGANTVGMFRVVKRRWPDERAKWLRALVRAMIYECLILTADQNLFRVYVWFHVSMIAVVAVHLRDQPQLASEEQNKLIAVPV